MQPNEKMKLNWSICHCRIWWIVAFHVLVFMCAWEIKSVWESWREQPVLVSIDDKIRPIASIPFPAVTICTTEKFAHGKIDFELFNTIMARIYKGDEQEELNLTALQ